MIIRTLYFTYLTKERGSYFLAQNLLKNQGTRSDVKVVAGSKQVRRQPFN
jgi:hypothetical protein